MLARRFLFAIAAFILLLLAVGLSWSLFQDSFFRWTFVPGIAFDASAAGRPPDYRSDAAWLAKPGRVNDPALYAPPGFTANAKGGAAIFYVAPTTYLSKAHWNAPLDDVEANARLMLFARSQASAFNGLGPVWAPRYRQATLGAFLAASDPRAASALDLAYGDVSRAFDLFVARQPAGTPLILAGHSQGSLHLLRLLREKVASTPLATRIVAVYAIGWPISVTADLPALGLPGCRAAGEARCIVSWQSFADPGDPRLIGAYFTASTGYTGRPRLGSAMLCVNPLTGTAGGSAPASANLGALVPHADLAGADLAKGLVSARCTPQGWLSIGAPPEGFGSYVLPGNNYHVFDYALFWANLRADAAARLASFHAK